MSDIEHQELTIPCDCSYLSMVRKSVHEVLSQTKFHVEDAHLIALAIDEAIANVIEHGFETCADLKAQEVKIVLDALPGSLEIRILDHGQPFNPSAVSPEVDLREFVRNGRKGGLGIFLIQKIMDEVHYDFKQGSHNELHMIKYVDNRAAKAKSEGST